MTCSHELRRVAPNRAQILLFILHAQFITQLLANYFLQYFAGSRTCNIDQVMSEQPERPEVDPESDLDYFQRNPVPEDPTPPPSPTSSPTPSSSNALGIDLDSVYQRNPALVEPTPSASNADIESPDYGLLVKAEPGNGLDFNLLVPMPLTPAVGWIRNERELKYPFDYMWEKIFEMGMQMAHHTKEEIQLYKDILVSKRAILVNAFKEVNDLREIIKVSEEISKADSWIELFESGANVPIEATLHQRFVTAYPRKYDARLSMLFVNYEIYQKQIAKPYWIQKIVAGPNRGRFKDSTGVWRKLFFDSTYNYCRFIERLTNRPPTLEDGLASPNANGASLLYDFESVACSLWPRSHCSKWSGTPDLEDGEPIRHGYSTCHLCKCLKCRDVCQRERIEADEDVEWRSDSSPKEPSVTQARRCDCSKCTRLVLREEYTVETILSAVTSVESSESYDASQAYHLVGALQPTAPPVQDQAAIGENNATDELYEAISFPGRPRAASPVVVAPPNDELQRLVRADAMRLYADMDYIRYAYDLLADPIGNLIDAARDPNVVTNEMRRYPHLYRRLMEAAEEAGVRRADDATADEAGLRNTLHTILLDHAHHARDRRWGEPDEDPNNCTECNAYGATHLDPHVPGGGRDPEQVVQNPTPSPVEWSARNIADLAQPWQAQMFQPEPERYFSADADDHPTQEGNDNVVDSDVSAPE